MPIFSKLQPGYRSLVFTSSKSTPNIINCRPVFPLLYNNSSELILSNNYAHVVKHKEEELSTDYSQFNWVAPRKETIVSAKTIRKYWELIPLLVALGVAGLGAVYMCFYSLLTKNDVMRTKDMRHGKDKPWDHADPTKTPKLYVPYEGARPIPELEELKKILKKS